MAVGGVQQCWLQDLSSDLRLDEVLDRIVENALQACPQHEFALLIMVEDELTIVRTSGLAPAVRRGIESWVREREDMLAEPVRHGALHALPLLFKDRSLGVLVTLTPDDTAFDDGTRELLEAFGEQAAVALANAHLFQNLIDHATQDALTGLPNRREFDRLFARELERSARYGDIFSLAILDLDYFKEVNDTQGHAAGDALLRRAAATIQEACRASDVSGRLGGDEFGLLLPEANQFEAAALCERLRAEIETLTSVSLSWGVAEYPTHGVTTATLGRAADAAMYASKPRLVGGERTADARSRV